jgi:putative transposase
MHRWALQDAPQLEAALHRLTRPMDVSWRLDETSIGVWGHWHSLDRADDTAGQPVNVRRTAHRDESAARCFHTQAIRRHGVPETLTIDGSAANAAAVRHDHGERLLFWGVTPPLVEERHESPDTTPGRSPPNPH